MRSLVLLAVSVCVAQQETPEKLIAAGHWKRARSLVDVQLRESPDDANASFLASQIRNAFGDRTSPPGLAERAVRLDGGVARYHRQLAEVQGVMAQHAGVFQQIVLARRFRKEIDMALGLDPRDTQALRDLLEFYLLAPGVVGGDARKAETVANQISAIDHTEGFLARARIAEFRKDREEAMLRLAAEIRPASYKAQMALAQFYLNPGHRNDEAAEILGKVALGIDKGRAGGYCVLAAANAGRSDWIALEGILSSAKREVPDDLAPYYRAAERLLRDGLDPVRAERYLRAYLTHEPEGNQPAEADAHWQLGNALRAQGQDAGAIREWRIAVQMDPESPAARELKRNPNGGRTSSMTRTGGAN